MTTIAFTRNSYNGGVVVRLAYPQELRVPCRYGSADQHHGEMFVRTIQMSLSHSPLDNSKVVSISGPAVKRDGTPALFDRQYHMAFRDLPGDVKLAVYKQFVYLTDAAALRAKHLYEVMIEDAGVR